MSLAFEGQNENRLPLRPPLHGSGPRFFKPLDNSRQFAFSKVVLKNQNLPFKFYPNESSKMGGVGARRERKMYFFDEKKEKKTLPGLTRARKES